MTCPGMVPESTPDNPELRTMLEKHQKIAIYMEDNLGSDYGKMGYGVMRFTENPIVAVIDSRHDGKTVNQACDLPFNYPVVATIDQAVQLGAEVLVLGTAPSGGRVPREWDAPLQRALELGLSIINGLHDNLNIQFGHLLGDNHWIWDVRQPAFTPEIASARAATLDNKRVLFVGTDMAIGKMTAGLELYRWVRESGMANGIRTEFLATGQIGITVTGNGIPLDAFKLDHACGAVETLVMGAADSDIVFIEGQGSLLHPGSSATLSLLRGSCPTHLVMCHRAGMETLRKPTSVKIPPLKEFIQLNEDLATVCGALPRATTIGIALNTSMVDEAEAISEISSLEDETGLPVTDVVRFGAEKLGAALL
jgi:uncharacterized NAD-dependent epimerase/dehydratase family protein